MGNSSFIVSPAEHGSTVFTIYINLANRTDRKKEMEDEFQRMGITTFERLNAIKRTPGALGCSLSQVEALKKGIQSGAAHIAVFEDDFQFLVTPQKYADLLQALCHIDYDVVMLDPLPAPGHVAPTTHPLLKRLTKSCNTGGYIVNQKYAPTLLKNFILGSQLLPLFFMPEFHVDIFKHMLERRDKWFCYHEKFGRQRLSYSDIEQKVRDRQ